MHQIENWIYELEQRKEDWQVKKNLEYKIFECHINIYMRKKRPEKKSWFTQLGRGGKLIKESEKN